ncbi:hypothetical protein LTR37_001959 [Vermiconidia calcicola]|uniref:Uncharacterized protein n=1 Tax=Vermiconidia calcicola TaxID=1690605 RepID=A0ACC3NUP7_9PEZI|nr:hypothetical protein LTR37_001959 [Vermiconidia calcicola]
MSQFSRFRSYSTSSSDSDLSSSYYGSIGPSSYVTDISTSPRSIGGSSSLSGETQPFRFLDLIAESRNGIYELCLVKGKVFLKPHSRYDIRFMDSGHYEKPAWSLLRVCRRVRNEASAILSSQNHFVLSHESCSDKSSPFWIPPQPTPHYPRRHRLGQLNRCNLQLVSITMDIRTLGLDPLLVADFARKGLGRTRSGLPFHNPMSREMGDTGYSDLINTGKHTWIAMCKTFATVKFLQIDLSHCYCPLGDKRLVRTAASAIATGFRTSSLSNRVADLPAEIEILGTKSKDERLDIADIINNALEKELCEAHKCILRFKVVERVGEVLLDWRDLEHGLETEVIDLSTYTNSGPYSLELAAAYERFEEDDLIAL